MEVTMEEYESFLAHPSLVDPEDNKRYLSDRYQYLCTFPEEIWEMILDQITDPQELEHIANSSLYFRSLVHHRLTEMLFPSVFGVLSKWYDRGGEASDAYRDAGTKEDDIKADFTYNDFFNWATICDDDSGRCLSCKRLRITRECSGILKLRLVCKAWSTGIENFYNCGPNFFLDVDDAKGEYHVFPWNAWQHYAFPNDRHEDVQLAFLRHFEKTHKKDGRSPFITKSIKINLVMNRTDLIEGSFLRSIFHILHKYGKHIKYCKIEDIEDTRVTERYFRLRQLLTEMPNLEYLEIKYNPKYAVTSREFAKLVPLIDLYPLPKLSQLTTLSVINALPPLFNELVHRNDHVTKLQLSTIFKEKYHYRLLSHITEFHVEINSPEHFVHMSPLLRFNYCLAKLNITIAHDKYTNLKECFRGIHSMCGDTLKHLVMMIARPIRKELADIPTDVTFKNLKKFHLTTEGYVSFDYLYVMKDSLEYLDVTAPIYTNRLRRQRLWRLADAHQTIKFLSCVNTPGTFSTSNIWNFFPRLKRIRYLEYDIENEDIRIAKTYDVCRWDWKMRLERDTISNSS